MHAHIQGKKHLRVRASLYGVWFWGGRNTTTSDGDCLAVVFTTSNAVDWNRLRHRKATITCKECQACCIVGAC